MTARPSPRAARQALELARLQERLADAARRAEGAQRLAAGLRRQLDCEIALLSTLRGNVESGQAALQALEGELAAARARGAALELEVAELRAHPLVVPRCRECVPDERRSETYHLRIGDRATGISPHVTVGFYDDGRVAEIWIRLDDKDKETMGESLADAAATSFSIALQWGSPLEEMARKWLGLRGGPAGAVWAVADPPPALNYEQACQYTPRLARDREVWSCVSLLDAIAKRLLVRFCGWPPFCPQAVLDEMQTEASPAV